MVDNSSNNKRIAKNTLLLYVRMLFLMIVSLYTSRVILNALGVEDYGIYNVVGGVVTMFTILSGTLNAAISRFLTFELGTGNAERIKTVFSSSVTIQAGLAVIIIVIAETLGLWFLNEKMVIPNERLFAANWCYQFSIITFAINLLSVPYNAAIIAHERMSAFAYISILEAIGKLVIAWCIAINPIDRLIFYGAMIAILSFVVRMVYTIYCKHNFEECKFHFVYDHDLLKQMFSFAGWNFLGAASAVLRDQGGNLIVNLFFGPTVNAAQAIASKVNATINGFVQNFMVALNPQITKSYANDDREYMFKLVFQGARLSYYILLLLSLPVFFNTHYILALWLKIVPEHTVLFVRLFLLLAMFESISYPLVTTMLATGKIKNYQLLVGGIQLFNLPISYIFLYLGGIPETIVIVAIVLGQLCLAARLYMLRKMVGLKIRDYLKNVYLNIIVVSLLSSLFPLLLYFYLPESLLTFLLSTFIALMSTVLVEFFIGCSRSDREIIYSYAKNHLHFIRIRK